MKEDENLLEVREELPSLPQELNFLTGGNFDRMMKVAEFFAQSDLIPVHFQRKPANVFIALEVAHRHNMSLFAVMQSLYVVHGRPGFEGKFLIALANQAGWNLQFDIEEDKAGNITACTAYSNRNGVIVRGPKVTQAMVKAEGWDRPKGTQTSKWVTMPSLMFRYRAGAYFVNTVCPQLKMGMPTVEEIEDMTVDISPIPETAMIAEPVQEAELPPPAKPDFDRLVSEANLDLDMVEKYTDAICQHKKCTPEDVVQGALAKWDAFLTSFGKWSKKQDKEQIIKAAESPTANDQPQSLAMTFVNSMKAVKTQSDFDKVYSEFDKAMAEGLNLTDTENEVLTLAMAEAQEKIKGE